MKRTHFYIAYAGNKRSEMIEIYNFIDFEGIDTIVEPYCGSCAMSYYIWLKHPDLKFILNDNNKYLLEMFDIIRDDNKLNEFEIKINDELMPILLNDKEKYVEFVKQNNIYSWYIGHKFYNIKPGLFPQNKKFNSIKISNLGITDFFKNANIEFHNMDGIEFYKNHKKKKNNLILLDPPYLSSCNDFYQDSNTNIYEYLYNNNINQEESKIYLILEKIWILELLFKNNERIIYNKLYQMSKKKTIHMIIKQN